MVLSKVADLVVEKVDMQRLVAKMTSALSANMPRSRSRGGPRQYVLRVMLLT